MPAGNYNFILARQKLLDTDNLDELPGCCKGTIRVELLHAEALGNLRVKGLGLRIGAWGLGLGVWGLGFRA